MPEQLPGRDASCGGHPHPDPPPEGEGTGSRRATLLLRSMAAEKGRSHPFLERLRRGPLLGDGAMGTQLHARGVSFDRSFDELNLTEPKIVEEIHRAYISAGSELIETNTFGANRIKLARHGLEGRVRDINFRAVKLAREAREISGEQVFIAGSVSNSSRSAASVSPRQRRPSQNRSPRSSKAVPTSSCSRPSPTCPNSWPQSPQRSRPPTSRSSLR